MTGLTQNAARALPSPARAVYLVHRWSLSRPCGRHRRLHPVPRARSKRRGPGMTAGRRVLPAMRHPAVCLQPHAATVRGASAGGLARCCRKGSETRRTPRPNVYRYAGLGCGMSAIAASLTKALVGVGRNVSTLVPGEAATPGDVHYEQEALAQHSLLVVCAARATRGPRATAVANAASGVLDVGFFPVYDHVGLPINFVAGEKEGFVVNGRICRIPGPALRLAALAPLAGSTALASLQHDFLCFFGADARAASSGCDSRLSLQSQAGLA